MPDDVTPGTDTPAPDPDKAPKFEGEFDAEKAARLVANLRQEVDDLKGRVTAISAERDEFKAAAEKTGTERDDALKAALKRAEDAERTLAISKHNLPDDVVEEFADYLTGTPEEVDAKAARLAARLVPAEPAADDSKPDESGSKGGDAPAEPGAQRPAPALTPGHGGDSPKPFDPKAIADEIRANA